MAYTRLLAVFLLTISITGCAVSRDPWNNAYPARCADLAGIELPVIEVASLPVVPHSDSRCGAWLQRPGGNLILLLKGCDKPRAETLRHELCHEKMWRMTGDPRWHD